MLPCIRGMVRGPAAMISVDVQSNAALVRLCWKDPRSWLHTRYWSGSMPVNFAGMVMSSAIGLA
eukprot:scaffold59189_cov29-Attheya_sp.AAC.1